MPFPLLAHLWLVASSPAPSELAPGEVDVVEVPWAVVQELRAALEDDPAAATPGPWVAQREIELLPVEGGLLLLGRWTIVAPQSGFLAQTLLGPGIELHSATLGGDVAPVVTLPGRGTMLAAWVERDVELKVRAFVPTSGEGRLELAMLPATRGRLRVAIPGRVPVPLASEGTAEAPPVLEGGVVWSGASTLAMELRDPAHAPPARQTLAVAQAGVGLTIGDAEVRGRAHLQWELRHGSLSRVSATVEGVGDDLTVEGRDVARWTRTGSTLEVELSEPVTTRVDFELRWTQAVGAGEQARLPLPRIEPQAWRSESSLQLGRDGEIEVIPEVSEGTAIAAASLPTWGQGLVEGTPTAAYQRAGGPTQGHLELLRFVPVPGPPTVIDVATYTVATTEEGRLLMKAHYDLRNDRGAHLTVRPPPGLRIIGARVGRDTALPSRDDDGAWRIPLRRSLETVDGLLSFPVEVILLGEREPWQRRERHELLLPTLDAPVAAARVTVFLPPGYRSRIEPGERNVVATFAEGEGLTYGKGVGAGDTAVADALLEEAVQGYLDNDFGKAQQTLAKLEELGLANENVARLQANIDVIEGKAAAKDKGDVTLQRRVKEQARARATEDFRRQEQLIAEASRAAEAGDYAEAEAQYEAALDLGGKLAKLEQTESVEQQFKNADVELELETVYKKKSKNSWKKAANYRTPDEPEPPASPSPDPTAARADAIRLGDVGVVSGSTNLDPATSPPSSDQEGEGQPEPEDDEPVPEPEPVLQDSARPLTQVSSPSYGTVRSTRGRSRRSRRNMLETKFKSAEPRRASRGPSHATSGDAGVALYDFEDDDVDGEVLRPEGASLSSRGRSTMASVITVPGTLDAPGQLAPNDDDAPPPDAKPTSERDAPRANGRNDRLPAPTVTASALSVVIPATGVAVYYEQLLLDANQTQTIEIHARRRLRR